HAPRLPPQQSCGTKVELRPFEPEEPLDSLRSALSPTPDVCRRERGEHPAARGPSALELRLEAEGPELALVWTLRWLAPASSRHGQRPGRSGQRLGRWPPASDRSA